jgi:hypothetical protein
VQIYNFSDLDSSYPIINSKSPHLMVYLYPLRRHFVCRFATSPFNKGDKNFPAAAISSPAGLRALSLPKGGLIRVHRSGFDKLSLR